ncbi:MAG: fibronectin type III domain-containing protein [Candidatus Krumholzibacteriia bacterium]
MKDSWILDLDREDPVPAAAGGADRRHRLFRALVPVAFLLAAVFALTGCSDDDCVNCLELESPPAPSGVFSLTGDNLITVYWNDIYFDDPDRVTFYRVYSRLWPAGDDDPFFLIGEVDWDENFDPATGRHWFEDTDVENGQDYEYAVSAVNSAGREGPLSFEFVVDTPLPISDVPVQVFDANGPNSDLSGFDFSRAAARADGRRDPSVPGTTADIRVFYESGVPFVEALRADVLIQDYGTFFAADGDDYEDFKGASWAPLEGYSSTGILELIEDHVYILRMTEPDTGEIHYAKLGVTRVDSGSVRFLWAYQLVPELRELKVPVGFGGDHVRVVNEFAPMKL